jgi:hypothetical protein
MTALAVPPRCEEIFARMQPDHAHHLLLDAALRRDKRALESWQRRFRLSGLECCDDGEFQLLPLVYSNLRDLDYSGSEMPKLQGILRQAWYRNQLLLGAVAGAMRQLTEAGVPALLIGGLGVIGRYYPEQRLRAVRQAELLVPLTQLDAATHSLIAGGWQPQYVSRLFPTVSDARYGHVAAFRKQRNKDLSKGQDETSAEGRQDDPFTDSGLLLHLHWRLLDPKVATSGGIFGARGSGLPKGLPWATRDHSVFMLDTETSLLEICMRAFPNHPASTPWIADASMILANCETSVDWDALVRQARERAVALPMLAALRCLADSDLAAIPASAIESLANSCQSPEAVEALDRLTLRHEARTLGQRLQLGLQVYALGEREPSWFTYISRLPGFLRYYWDPQRATGQILRAFGMRRPD